MVTTFLLIALVIIAVLAVFLNRWTAGLKTPSKGKKFQAKRHK